MRSGPLRAFSRAGQDDPLDQTRRSPRNMCSVRHSPMPSAPRAGTARVLRRVGVSTAAAVGAAARALRCRHVHLSRGSRAAAGAGSPARATAAGAAVPPSAGAARATAAGAGRATAAGAANAAGRIAGQALTRRIRTARKATPAQPRGARFVVLMGVILLPCAVVGRCTSATPRERGIWSSSQGLGAAPRPRTSTGTVRLSMVPSPSCPFSLGPQQTIAPTPAPRRLRTAPARRPTLDRNRHPADVQRAVPSCSPARRFPSTARRCRCARTRPCPWRARERRFPAPPPTWGRAAPGCCRPPRFP